MLYILGLHNVICQIYFKNKVTFVLCDVSLKSFSSEFACVNFIFNF